MTPKRVVCIEDEIEMIDLVKMILTREGFEVIGLVLVDTYSFL